MLLVHKDKYLFHITHIKNISAVLKKGLLSKNELIAQKIVFNDISEDKIQSARAKIIIPGSSYTLHDCVPMFFGARPPMLLAVRGKGIPQEDVIYVVVNWQILSQENVWFTDGNARDSDSKFYGDLKHLDQVDFAAAGAYNWGGQGKTLEFKRKKQAEVLKLKKVLLDEIIGFAVYNDKAQAQLQKILDAQGVARKIIVIPEWYYS